MTDTNTAAQRLDAAIAEIGKAWADLKAATEQANAGAPEDAHVALSTLRVLAGQMLHTACGGEIQPEAAEGSREVLLGRIAGHFARLPIAAEEAARKARGMIHG
ncbi:hypothetical protein D3C78_573260 [compost metagenome]